MRGTGPKYPNMDNNIQDMKNFGRSAVRGVGNVMNSVGKGINDFVAGNASYQKRAPAGQTYLRGQLVPMQRQKQALQTNVNAIRPPSSAGRAAGRAFKRPSAGVQPY